jgi:hypothetical protein
MAGLKPMAKGSSVVRGGGKKGFVQLKGVNEFHLNFVSQVSDTRSVPPDAFGLFSLTEGINRTF